VLVPFKSQILFFTVESVDWLEFSSFSHSLTFAPP
jgi:hypothetical protein